MAPATQGDGLEVVLKITFPHEDPRFEAEALRVLDGQGAVRLLRTSADGFALLLERCRPGTNLWSLGETKGHAVACRLLSRLWREPAPDAPFVALADYVTGWWGSPTHQTDSADYGEEIVAEAKARGHDLLATQTLRVLLHGDFHPGNILAAEREPWLCIDPKPLIGDPAYDLAQWLANRARLVIGTDDAVLVLRRQIDRFAVDLGLDPARIAGWAFVKSLGWQWEPPYVTLFQRLAHAW